MKTTSRHPLLLAAALAAIPVLLPPAEAQDQTAPQANAPANVPGQLQLAQANGPPGATALQEVIVTAARKRPESILNVPVIEQAIQQGQMSRLQVTGLTDVPKLVPGLNLGHSLLSIGTLVSIRGVGTASQDPGVDQSVSLNVDGLSLTNGLAYQSALFDVGQIEVLKGPQVLFYGKSNTGGVIAIHTADPTNKAQIIAQGGYEFEAGTRRGELILSGPVTPTLGLRLSTLYSASDGYFNNAAVALPGTGAVTPTYRHAPNDESYIIRGTALWNPGSQLTARLKVNYTHDKSIYPDTFECTNAPSGTGPFLIFPPLIVGDPCNGLSRTLRVVFLDPAAFPGALNNGVPFLTTNQGYGTLELNYRPTGDITLTSVTGYYNLSSESLVNATQAAYAGPFIGVNNRFHRREFTEELRVNSEFSGPVNFTAGALHEDANLIDHVQVLGNGAYKLPTIPLVDGVTPIDIKTESIYGQLRWNILERLQLAGGLRWSDEKRTESPFTYDNVTLPTPVFDQPAIVPNPRLHSKTYSPEITLTYKPSANLTWYASWKRGFKSGSFSVATPAITGVDNSFGDEKAKGGEIGLKSFLLEHRLQLNVAAYDYDYTGLQVGVISPPQNGVPFIHTVNAATARTYGIDLDGAYLPDFITGLTVNGAIEWNHARYLNFTNAPCWGGQTIAEGCNQSYNPAVGLYTAQNLSRTPLIRAPAWQATLGFEYEIPLRSNYTLVLTNSNEFSSKYVTYLAVNRPNNDNYQDAFAKVDLGVTLQSPSDFWEAAVIGKDINDKLTAGNCVSSPLQTGATIDSPSGGTATGPLGIDPAGCFTDPGREVWLRVTLRPLAGRD